MLKEFKSWNRIEIGEDSEDRRLAHLISLIGVIFKKCSQLKVEFDDDEFFDFVISDWLFRRRKDKLEANYPIWKTDLTREKCFELLVELMNTKDNKYFARFSNIVSKWMQRAKWRTAQEKDWEIKNFEKSNKRKSKFITSSEFIGLENLGCTW